MSRYINDDQKGFYMSLADLHRDQEFYSLLLDSIQDPINVVDTDLNYVWVNQAFSDARNQSREEIIGQKCYDWTFNREEPCEGCPVILSIEDMKPHERIMDWTDGTTRSVASQPIIRDNQVIGVIEVARDLTNYLNERQRYENTLLALNRHGSEINQVETELQLGEHLFNTIEQLLGYSFGSFGILKENAVHYIHAAGITPEFGFVQPLDGKGVVLRAVHSRETVNVPDTRKDPDYIKSPRIQEDMLSELVVPVILDDEVVAVINIESTEQDAFTVQDQRIIEAISIHATAGIQQIRHLRRLTKMQAAHEQSLIKGFRRVSSMVRHDLRTPLTAIANAAYLLKDDPGNRELNEIIANRAKYIDNIIEDWRQQTHTGHLMRADTDITKLFNDAVNACTIPDNIKMSHNVAPDLQFNLDKNSMMRVLCNLIVNSTEAMPQGGTITLKAEINDDHLIISVTDTGRGIPRRHLNKIFTPFYTTKPDGMGIGLTYVKQAVEAHNGTITLDTKYREGTTFTITIPQDHRTTQTHS
ncbi:MAG: ATP-binding protein [Candidatus Bathyarchaeota archaeon]|nr:ATP-binding protein [Candidatus Bathyarchaeota archaeon]